MVNSVTQLMIGIVLAMIADLCYSYVTVGHGLHPLLCMGIAVVLTIGSICSHHCRT